MAFLDFADFVTVERDGKDLIARFNQPALVLSSDPEAGGIREDVTACYNHQLCEASGDGHTGIRDHHLAALHSHRCQRHGLDPQRTISLGTAANMRCAGLSQLSFDDLRVAAVCTAGVEGNAMRAGEPAGFHEREGEIVLLSEHSPPVAETIITMIFVNQQLSPGALVRAVMTATEAKTAALTDLLVASRFGSTLATGTGSDQILISCPRDQDVALRHASGHAKLGELIAQTTRTAITQALAMQNTLTPAMQCSLFAQLARFGVSADGVHAAAQHLLPPDEAEFLAANLLAVDRDPFVVAAAGSIAAISDQLAGGILPQQVADDLAERVGAVLAQAVALGEGDLEHFRRQLLGSQFDPATLVPHAICLGFSYKWRSLDATLSAGGTMP